MFTDCLIRFFFNDTATTEIYTLSLHDALPILAGAPAPRLRFSSPLLIAWRHACRAASPQSPRPSPARDRKSTRLNSSHANISYAVFCLKKKKRLAVTSYVHIPTTLLTSAISPI